MQSNRKLGCRTFLSIETITSQRYIYIPHEFLEHLTDDGNGRTWKQLDGAPCHILRQTKAEVSFLPGERILSVRTVTESVAFGLILNGPREGQCLLKSAHWCWISKQRLATHWQHPIHLITGTVFQHVPSWAVVNPKERWSILTPFKMRQYYSYVRHSNQQSTFL